MAILPTSCSSAALGHVVELLAGHVAARARPPAPARPCRAGARAGRAGARTGCAAGRRATGARPTRGARPCGRTCAGRRAAAPRSASWPPSGSRDDPVRGASPRSPRRARSARPTQASTSTSDAGRAGRAAARRTRRRRAGRRRPCAPDRVGEALAEPHEQPVAGGVAEGVVVLLEAVEVEQDAARAGCVEAWQLELVARGRPSGCAGCSAR